MGREGSAQSNHTVIFSNAPSDFNALEKISAMAGNTDYYITFDQDNLYIGAFRTAGTFAATDNLAVYLDTDPRVPLAGGNGSLTGMAYNGVTPTLPFPADYNVYAEEGSGQANQYAGGWTAGSGPVYSAGPASREIRIPFTSLGNPYALNLVLWMGGAGTLYSNAPGADLAPSATPVILDFFGTFGIRNGTLGGVNPVNVVTLPATGYLSASTVTGGSSAYVDVTGTTTINGLTLAPGGVIHVNTGKTLVLASGYTINNTAVIQNTKSTLISVSGSFTNQGRAYCSWFNVNDGGTYTHDVAGSIANGAAADWPGTNWRTYGTSSSVNIKQWAQNSGTAVVGIPGPTSGGWGNVAFNLSQSFASIWNQNGAFNHVGGNLVMNDIGTNDKYSKFLTFNPSVGDSVIDIGGNFEMNTNDDNGIILSLVNNASRVQTMNVHGDFIVKGSGHIKFGYHTTPAIINYWGNYSQTGGEIKSAADPGTWVTINSRGVNKTIAVSTSASFNTNYINWVIASGAVIDLASNMYFFGDDATSPSNAMVTVNGRLNCNGYAITDEYFKSYFTPTSGNGKFILADGGTLGIGHVNGITSSGSGFQGPILGFSPAPAFGNIQISDRTFSTKANYIYNGNSGQVTGSGLPGTVNSLIIDNSGTASKTVSLTNDVTVTSLHEMDQGIFSLGSKNVTLHSGPDTTATFGRMGTGSSISYGTGRYLVERYINTGTAEGQHGKSWQFLSTPADGETVLTCWQEGGSAAPGHGTWITDPSGTGSGFDAYSIAPSIKTYDPATNDWAGIGSTGNLIANPNGYFLFVRGDRTATGISSPATPTTLRIKGKLFTGDQPPVPVPAGSFQAIGNPMASQVDFQKIYTLSSGIDNTYYAWDPSISGTHGVGGYQTLSSTVGFQAVPGSGTYYNEAVSYPYIQSGQAFFVYNSGATAGSVEITEDCKEPGSRLVNRAGGPAGERQFLFASLLTSSGILADGNAVAFDPSFSNKPGRNDAVKIPNAGENFGLAREGKILAVEAHSPRVPGDTIFYDMRKLEAQDYSLVFVPRNMGPEPGAWLVDQYLKTETPVSLSDSTRIRFSVTADPASSAAGRFVVVFRPSETPSALTFLSVTAWAGGQGVRVYWQVANERDVKKYEMERSSDGIHFSEAGDLTQDGRLGGFYNLTDNQYITGDAYYRITAVFSDGHTAFSPMAHLFGTTAGPAFAIYPNPVKEGRVNLQLIDQPPGKYRVRLLNSLGDILLTRQFEFGGGSGSAVLETGRSLPDGIYHLQIEIPGGGNRTLNVQK